MKANHRAINVDELMIKIREQVAQRQNSALSESPNRIVPIMSTVETGHIEALVNDVESRAYVRTTWPEKYNRFPLKLSKKLQKLSLKVLEIIFRDQRGFNFSLLQALREFLLVNRQLIQQIATLQAQVSATDTRFQAMDERVNAIDTCLQATDERVSATDTRLQAMDERVSATDTRLQATDERVSAMDEERVQTLLNEDRHLLDAFYVAFEERFRGSRKDIIDRLQVYLPLIEEAKIDKHSSHILDVGCGRGEWLELLHITGYTAQGLDTNRGMIDQCRARGLQVIEGDVISYLQFLPEASLDALTGFHIIEHLPFKELIKLFDETVRVLKPGGIAIFETPNPKNVLVGSHTFYIDPTHFNPLPSSTIEFMAEARGLCRVKTMDLHPYPEKFRLTGSELAERFNDYFYGSQDYAVIGYKA